MKKLSQNMHLEYSDKKLFYESLYNKEYEIIDVPYDPEHPLFPDLLKQFDCIELRVERLDELWRHIILVPVYCSQQLQNEIAKRLEIVNEQKSSKPGSAFLKYLIATILVLVIIIFIFFVKY